MSARKNSYIHDRVRPLGFGFGTKPSAALAGDVTLARSSRQESELINVVAKPVRTVLRALPLKRLKDIVN